MDRGPREPPGEPWQPHRSPCAALLRKVRIPQPSGHGDRGQGRGAVVTRRMNLLGEPGMGLSGGPGKPVPNVAEVRALARRQVWGLLIALLLLATSHSWVHRHQPRDVVTGAHGPFPAAVGAGAPVAPEHVVRRTSGFDEALVHGLYVRQTGSLSGVTAANVRTGKEYWRYERPDSEAGVNTFDVSERTVVAAFGDGRLIGVDLRTGKPLWHVEIQHAKGHRTTALAGGQALTEAPGAVRAFAERDGRSLWTAKTPRSCPDGLVITAYALPGHLSVVPLVCNVTSPDRGIYYHLLGIDNRTGKVLWQQHTAAPRLMVRGGEHTLVIPDPDHPPAIQLLDVNRQGATARALTAADAWDAVAAGGGIVLSAIDPGDRSEEDHDTLLRAYRTRDGHLAWQLRAPTGQEYGFPEIADGRVYVARQPFLTGKDTGRRIRADLLVLDAGTGRLLHTLRLPAMTVPDESRELDVRDIGDGAVSIGWRDSGGDVLIAAD
ncbi:PQQ-binding-like beta-propeller repeat protein [Streptomyces krungchingensis]|uniref:outer membrane protein assembly factor BamB family protein n=1 Tax=Streptomyces krungchingensis TaxID=1565034 RepID=UPI003CE979B4